MKCSEVMTKDPASVVPTETVVRAAQLMKGEDVGPVLVVQDKTNRKLVGIVTDRDLALEVVAQGREPNSVRVQEVMTSDPISCRPDDNVNKAMKLMKEHQVRRIPVVDRDERVVGIIAQADIAREVGDEEVGDLVSEVSEGSGDRSGLFKKSHGHGASHERWNSATRMAIAAAGGGLLVYGLRSKGRTRQIATTAGAALVARGLTGRPFEGFSDIMNPTRAFGF